MTAAATATKPATAIKTTAAEVKTTKPAAAKVTTPAAKTATTTATPTITKTAVPPQVMERIATVWTTEPERRFAVKAWKHATGIRKSQGTPHGLTKEQAAAIVARVAEFSR
jgi:hypothetical protein